VIPDGRDTYRVTQLLPDAARSSGAAAPAIRRDPSAIESSAHLLMCYCW
jgi:hypothetical protein